MQPSYNIGLVGHVSHGKSTCCKILTGIETFRHSKEKTRGSTMKLGYTNCKIFKCIQCSEPICYQSCNSSLENYFCKHCNEECILVEYFSFVDCPGHESLMNVMLSGTTIMDYAILLIDGSITCPQPQTIEHLAALEILQVNKIIVIQNKLDLVDGKKAIVNYKQIKEFLKGSCAENSPIIPVSAQRNYNMDIVCESIVKYFGKIDRKDGPPKMNVIRSFDVNKPGSEIDLMVGGVLGGSLMSGCLKVGDELEIRPGLVTKNKNGNVEWKPIKTTITSIKTDDINIPVAFPGGLVGICTNIDPALTRSDKMVGQIAGISGTLPEVRTRIKSKCIFMNRGEKQTKIKPSKGDMVLLNIASKSVRALVKMVSGSTYIYELITPCCMDTGDKFSISVKSGESWRLSAMGKIIG